MTTIVYDHKNKQVAVDSRIAAGGNIKSDSYDKTIKKDDGALWFISGYECESQNFSNLNHGDKIESELDCYAIVIKNGKAYSAIKSNGVLGLCELKWNDAIGSGCEFALASLEHGKSAKEAVEYAITKDCFSGGKVNVYNLSGEQI